MQTIEHHKPYTLRFFKLPISDKIQLTALLYLTIWVSSPFLAYGSTYRLLAFASIFVWILVELFRKNNIFIKPPLYLILTLFFIFYTTLISYNVDGISAINRNIQFYMMLFFIFIYAAYERRSLYLLKPIVYINIILFTLWAVTTYKGLLIDPHASRYVIKSNAYARQLMQQGVGGFAFIYSLLIYNISVLALLRYKYLKYKKFSIFTYFLIFSVGISSLVILKAGYSIAVILWVLSMVFFFFYSQNPIKNIFLLFFIIILYFFLQSYLLDMLKLLYNSIDQGAYRLKLGDIIASMEIGKVTGTTADRVERYMRSLMIFMEHPIMGIWRIAPIGKHSLVLDTFAQYGFFMGIILIYILLKIPLDLYIRIKKAKALSVTILALAILLISLNNVAMLYGFILYLFYPYIIKELSSH